MRTENPVAERHRLSPRTVPLHKRWVDKVVAVFVREMRRSLGRVRGEAPLGHGVRLWGRRLVLGDLETVAHVRVERFRLRTVTSTRLRTLSEVGGALSYDTASMKGGSYQPTIEVQISGRFSPAETLSYLTGEGLPNVRRVLAHELTHLVDAVPDRKRASGSRIEDEPSLFEYVNHPGEAAAYRQEMVAEALESAEYFPRVESRATASAAAYVERALATSPTYQYIGPMLSEENERALLRTLAQAMQRRGLLDAFEEPLRQGNPVAPEDRLSPRTVPLDRRWVDGATEAALRLAEDALAGRSDTEWLAPGMFLGELVLDDLGLERASGERIDHLRLTVRTSPAEKGPRVATGYMMRSEHLPAIVVLLPGGLYVDDLRAYLENEGRDRLRSLLAHELTHVVDPALYRVRSYVTEKACRRGYVNQPVEQKAIEQQIVAEALDAAPSVLARAEREGYSTAFSIDTLLRFSPTWRQVESDLSPASVRTLLRVLAASLGRRGLLAPFAARSSDLP